MKYPIIVRIGFAVRILALMILVISSSLTQVQAKKSVNLTFCYESKELLPYYIMDSLKVPQKHAGVVIDAIRELDAKVAGVNIKLIRQPWMRCLSDLETGRVSAVIGTHTAERAIYSAFPLKENKLDTNKAFSRVSTCLIHQKSELIGWNGKKFALESSPTISIPRGYHIANLLRESGFTVYDSNSSANSQKLLFTKQVSASVNDCKKDNLPDHITVNPIPIETHYGYLLISKVFYKQHKELSEKLWRELAKIDKQKFFKNYITH